MAGPLDSVMKELTGTLVGVFTGGEPNALTASILRKETASAAYNPRDGSRAAAAAVSYAVTAGPPIDYSISAVNGETIKKGDFRVCVAAAGMTIEPNTEGDVLLLGTEKFKIVNVSKKTVGSTVVAYWLQCRR